ncbi:MAG: PD-(D/E)XK nuclease family transposase [Eggerthellaceae bacterium]|nr:PD-(D/E)XK nuclease family transposase [Eggerthellaceae bacterium]
MAEPGYTRYTPLYDWAFKRIFGSEDSRAVTMPFVNAVLRHVGLPEIERIDEIGSDVAIPNVVGLKAPSVDVLLVSDGRVIDLEAQTMRVDVESKMTYYAASLLARRVRRGEDPYYRNLPQVVVISLVQGWTVFAGPQAVTLGRMCWERGGGPVPGRDKVALVVCELDKVAARYNGASEALAGDELAAWLYVLAEGYRRESEVERMTERLMGIEEFHELYGLTMGDPAADRQYAAYVDGVMTRNDAYAYGRDDGRAQTLADVVAVLADSGADESTIAKVRALAN